LAISFRYADATLARGVRRPSTALRMTNEAFRE
jgi:hypothetical protein